MLPSPGHDDPQAERDEIEAKRIEEARHKREQLLSPRGTDRSELTQAERDELEAQRVDTTRRERSSRYQAGAAPKELTQAERDEMEVCSH